MLKSQSKILESELLAEFPVKRSEDHRFPRGAHRKIKSLSLKDAEGKVASVILQLADDIGKIKNGTVEIEKLPLQHDLANMAGTARETISRTLHSLVKKELIDLKGTKLRIINYTKNMLV